MRHYLIGWVMCVLSYACTSLLLFASATVRSRSFGGQWNHRFNATLALISEHNVFYRNRGNAVCATYAVLRNDFTHASLSRTKASNSLFWTGTICVHFLVKSGIVFKLVSDLWSMDWWLVSLFIRVSVAA